jgi:hypothetical protein
LIIYRDPFAIFENFKGPILSIFFYILMEINMKLMKDLYELGARRIGVFSLSPVGCVPLQRTIKGGIRRNCVENVNEGALIFNSKLSTSIIDLSKKLPDSRVVYLENFSLLHDMIINHNNYGKYIYLILLFRSST